MRKYFITALLILAGTGITYAEHNRDTGDTYYDYARVVSVEPVYKQVAHRIPQQECYVETVRYPQSTPQNRSATSTILGAMIGAAVGNQIGHDKQGRRIGRAAGAVLGASIGHDAAKRQPKHNPSAQYIEEERCETHYTNQYEEQLLGYNVSYRYHGKLYYTQMPEHPGRKIRVAVDVRPAY